MKVEIEEIDRNFQTTGRYWNVTVEFVPRAGDVLIVAMANKGEIHMVDQVIHRVELDHSIVIRAMLQ